MNVVRTAEQGSAQRLLRHPARLLALSLALLASFGCRAQQSWPLWKSYTTRMVDDQGRVIDHTAGDKTTSEGQSYALFFALVANDRPRFDRLLAWTESNLAGGNLAQHLPAWSWGKAPDGSWRVLDPNPASDADLWIAYDLLEAARLWHEPRFDQLARTLLLRIAQQEVASVPGVGTTLLPGPFGFHPDPSVWYLNPSYLPLPVLTRLASAQPNGPWSAIAAGLPSILRYGSGAGFPMDWVLAGAAVRPVSAAQAHSGSAQLALPPPTNPAAQLTPAASTPVSSYEAIRVYLWLGMADEQTPGRRELLSLIPGMASFLKANPTPPAAISAEGSVVDHDSPPGFSAAVIPYLEALGFQKEAAIQLTRLNSTRDPATGLFGQQAAYYDQNLALFGTGYLERRFRFDRSGQLLPRWK